MSNEPTHLRFPKVDPLRRGGSLAIDFIGAWLFCSLVGGNWLAQGICFILIWLGMRVVLVYQNQGQSLGRWMLDMKVVDVNLGRVPGLQNLAKREGIAGLAAALAAIGINSLSPTNWAALLLVIPLAADCGIAWNDPMLRQAFHDRVGRTIIVGTRRGYSLDLKIKKWVAQARRIVKQ